MSGYLVLQPNQIVDSEEAAIEWYSRQRGPAWTVRGIRYLDDPPGAPDKWAVVHTSSLKPSLKSAQDYFARLRTGGWLMVEATTTLPKRLLGHYVYSPN